MPPPCACITFPLVSVQVAPGTMTAAWARDKAAETAAKIMLHMMLDRVHVSDLRFVLIGGSIVLTRP
jgi:hypothetical protein